MPVLNWPSTVIAPSSATFRLVTNTQTFRSPLDGTRQTLAMPGSAWAATLTWNTLNETYWRTLHAFIVSLQGPAGRFYYGPPHASKPKGAITLTPTVNGASQVGTTLAITGAGINITGVFKAGDFISFDTAAGRELKMITADANTNASGQATLSIAPPIRTSPANGATVTHQSPSCVMMLADDGQGAFEFRPGTFAGLTLEIVEAFT